MATIVLTAVGTSIGGPIGGAIGAFVGQQVDRAIFSPGSREGPRLKELSVTTSSYGQPIPRNFGRMRVAGTVIWSTDLIESSTKVGGGKGQPSTRSYSYSASFAVALSSTPIKQIGRIWADGNLLRGVGGDLKVEGAMRVYLGTGDNDVDPLIAAERNQEAPAFRDCAYVVFENLQLAAFGNRIPALTFEIFAPDDSRVTLDQLVPLSTDASESLAIENARGISDEGGSIGATLGAIDRVFPLTCITTGRGLRLSSKTTISANVPTLPAQLAPANAEDADARHQRRGDKIDFEPLALRYYDEERDYQPSVQRALGLRPDGRERMLDLPATMTASGARQAANANAHRTRWRGEHVIWRVGELDIGVMPGSVVRLPGMNGLWRVQSWEWFDRGIELGLDRLAPDLAVVAASDPGSANLPEDTIATPTILDAFEVPPDNTSDLISPLVFAAATSTGPGWRGASLFVEQGGTLQSIGSSNNSRAIFGALVKALPASGVAYFQPNDFLEVELVADDLGFVSTDMIGLAQGANRLLVGDEVIQFLNAFRTNTGTWKLEGLLRGRAGTEPGALVDHPAGQALVLLDDNLSALDTRQVPASPATRIAAMGIADDEPVFSDLRNNGLSRRPPMPVMPRASRSSDGSWVFEWTRRARGQWRWPETTEVPLIEERELYSVGVGPSDTPHATWAVEEPLFRLGDDERLELVALYGPQPLWVEQIGTFGRSRPFLLASIH